MDLRSVLLRTLEKFPNLRKLNKVYRSKHSRPAVYCLIHVKTGRLYVGSTEDLYVRVNQHRTMLLSGKHKNRNVQELFHQDTCFDLFAAFTPTKETALDIEQQILDQNKTNGILLNLSFDSRLANKGVRLSEDVKKRLRETTLQQFASEESKIRHGLIIKTKWLDPEYRRKQENRTISEVQKKQIGLQMKKLWSDPVFLEKMRNRRRRSLTVK